MRCLDTITHSQRGWFLQQQLVDSYVKMWGNHNNSADLFYLQPAVVKAGVFCKRISAYIPTLSLPLLLQLGSADKDKTLS